MDKNKIAIVVGVILLVAVVGFFIWKKKQHKTVGSGSRTTSTPATGATGAPATGATKQSLVASPFVGGTPMAFNQMAN